MHMHKHKHIHKHIYIYIYIYIRHRAFGTMWCEVMLLWSCGLGVASFVGHPHPPGRESLRASPLPPEALWAPRQPPWRSPRPPGCSRWLPRRPRQAIKAAQMAQHASKTATESTKMPQDCVETAHEAAKTAQVRPTEPREASKMSHRTPQRSPEEAKTSDFLWVSVGFWYFSKL